SPPPIATYPVRPSGLPATPRGRSPTGTRPTTLSVAASMIVKLLERSFETYTKGSALAPADAPASPTSDRVANQMRPCIMSSPPSRHLHHGPNRHPLSVIAVPRASRLPAPTSAITVNGPLRPPISSRLRGPTT